MITPILLPLFASSLWSIAHTAVCPREKDLVPRAEPRQIVLQQDFEQAPPFPFLDVGLQHMVSDLVANGTEVDVKLIVGGEEDGESSSQSSILENLPPTQCGLGSPCADASCCNSVSTIISLLVLHW